MFYHKLTMKTVLTRLRRKFNDAIPWLRYICLDSAYCRMCTILAVGFFYLLYRPYTTIGYRFWMDPISPKSVRVRNFAIRFDVSIPLIARKFCKIDWKEVWYTKLVYTPLWVYIKPHGYCDTVTSHPKYFTDRKYKIPFENVLQGDFIPFSHIEEKHLTGS